MKLGLHAALDRLASDEPCLGAAFTSFTFDPTFFEEHVLATVLRLGSDPTDDANRYFDEACAALQSIPVSCIVDGKVRPAGHRLPFELREVRARTFHPKVSLLAYEAHARLSVGSGNLTQAGYGRNAELFFTRDLVYAEPEDAATLREVVAFFRALDLQASPRGTCLSEILGTVERRLPPSAETARSLRFIHTEGSRSILDQVLALLPDTAKIDRLGVLAPFFEQDDRDAAQDSSGSVLAALSTRAGKQASIDLGVPWEPASIAPSAVPGAVEPGWWAVREDDERITYVTLQAATAGSHRAVDAAGVPRLLPKDTVDQRIARGAMWPAGTPRVFAPQRLIENARACVGNVATWLFPSPQIIDGRVLDRPLHAKALLITYRRGRTVETLVVMGSANASRMAMLETPASGGNVEACLAFLVDGELPLSELVPGLAHCAAPVEWVERELPEPDPLPSIPWVEGAFLDVAARSLEIQWTAQSGVDVHAWSVHYGDRELLRGHGMPSAPSIVTPFELQPASCELVVRAVDGERAFPIVVDDLSQLVVSWSPKELELRDLLALVGRRISLERHRTVIASYGPEIADSVLIALLGEGFAPTDVFRAWWTVAHDLHEPALTTAGFRLRLEGALGADAVWRRLLALVDHPEGLLGRQEIWFYGAELVRELSAVEAPPGPDHVEKQRLLSAYLARVRGELAAIAPDPHGPAWVRHLVAFYGGAS